MQTRSCKLKIRVKYKSLKGIGPENLSNPKFIATKAMMNPKTYESKLNWN